MDIPMVLHSLKYISSYDSKKTSSHCQSWALSMRCAFVLHGSGSCLRGLNEGRRVSKHLPYCLVLLTLLSFWTGRVSLELRQDCLGHEGRQEPTVIRREYFTAVGKVPLAHVRLIDLKVIGAEKGCASVGSRIAAGSVRNARPEDDNIPY